MPIRWSYAEINRAIEQLRDQDNVSRPDGEQLRRMAEPHGNRTEFGSLAFSSSVRSRSKDKTVIIGGPDVQQTDLNDDQKRIMRDLPETLNAVHSYMQHTPIVCTARSLGNNKEFS